MSLQLRSKLLVVNVRTVKRLAQFKAELKLAIEDAELADRNPSDTQEAAQHARSANYALAGLLLHNKDVVLDAIDALARYQAE